jgi:lysozyme
MEAKLMDRIKEQLVRHEGLRLKPYRCTAGKLTIGYGRNLDDRGISKKEAYAMLEKDILDCEQWLIDEIPEVYNKLDEVRQSVLLNMCISIPQSRKWIVSDFVRALLCGNPATLVSMACLASRTHWLSLLPETGNGLPMVCLLPCGRSRLVVERLSYPN